MTLAGYCQPPRAEPRGLPRPLARPPLLRSTLFKGPRPTGLLRARDTDGADNPGAASWAPRRRAAPSAFAESGRLKATAPRTRARTPHSLTHTHTHTEDTKVGRIAGRIAVQPEPCVPRPREGERQAGRNGARKSRKEEKRAGNAKERSGVVESVRLLLSRNTVNWKMEMDVKGVSPCPEPIPPAAGAGGCPHQRPHHRDGQPAEPAPAADSGHPERRHGSDKEDKKVRPHRSAPSRPHSPGRVGATGPAASARPRPCRLGQPRAALCERGGGGGRGRRGAGGGGCLRTAGRGGAGPGRRALFRPGAAAAKVCLARGGGRGGQRRRVLPAGRAAAGAAHLREGGSPPPALRPCCVIASLGWRSSAGNGSARSARCGDVSRRRKSREGGTEGGCH